MSNSPLVDYVLISPNKNSPRQDKIRKITIHHMAGNISVEACGRLFQSRQASSNYGIDNSGRVGMYVEEKDRSWCSASYSNDHQAITIELANDGGSPDWHVSDKVLNKCIDLCVDICQRNGIEKLVYTGDTSGNLTRHNMFCATVCPGPYLQSKFPWIAEQVNARLQEEEKDMRLKIGYASGGDIRTFERMLAGMGVDYTELNGYITTGEMSRMQAALIQAKAAELVVPCVVLEESDPAQDETDWKAKYTELKEDYDNFRNVVRTISKELGEAVK